MEEIYSSRSMSRSKSAWRGADDQIFSRSIDVRNEVEDEEALIWAALEKLPTYNRVRKGVMAMAEGELKEVDIRTLDLQERRNLLERLVKVAEEDHERFLLKLKNRIDRVGLDFPTIEMRFENLNIEAEASVGSRSLPSFYNAIMNKLEAIANYLHILPNKKRPFTILHNLSGIIKAHRMTLLLGPPGSGKTTVLLALAGKLSSDLKVSGKVTYNGHGMDEFVPQRTAAYISQHDLHMGEMTVRETLMFSARCQGVGCRYDMLTELSRREKAANIKPDPDIDVFMKATSIEGKKTGVITDYIMKILGLDICADTMIGDEMIRGISGGQKRRVTTGEMIVGPAQALLMDEISNGLDSSTTYQIVKSLRQITHILGGTTFISLLQPAPETYELFDDIILLSDGLIVYQGPRKYVLEFFQLMGFNCPERKGVADFLQEVTSKKDQQQYWIHHDKPYKFVSVVEFAEAFQSFHVGRELTKDLSVPFDKSKSHPAALTTSKYGVSQMELLKACAEREVLLLKRNSFVYAFRSAKVLVMTLIMMTVFLRNKMHHRSINDGIIFMGALFFLIVNIMFNGFSELSMTIAKLPVFFKQRDSLFYPSWTYAIPTWIVKIPFSVVEVAILVMISYYVVGCDPNVGRFLKQFVVILLVHQMAAGLFRFVGSIGRNMFMAAALSFYILFIFLVLGGFIIAHGDIKKFWIWGYWMSPIMYSYTAISVNEFLGNSWSHKLPGSNQTLGVAILKSRDMFTEAKWYWIGVVALLGYVFVFNFLFAVSLTYLKPIKKGQPALSEEALKKRQIIATNRLQHSSFEGENCNRQTSARDKSMRISPHDSNPTELNTRKQMALPFVPLSLTFDNIKYSVDMPQEMKGTGVADKLMLLKGVSGCFRPGVLTALMGVSGAGKTTLMDVLAGRKTGGYIEGGITISGYPKKQETFARVSGYCEQNDIHSPHVTVYESLVYSAWLRLPSEVDSKTREMFIEEVMELVEMASLRNALVGLPGANGLSTEQRKRLTIAVELIANPSIIFMDEPTSGLDARAAAIVMRTVRNTVDTGRTVVCTIHQPSIDIFEAFDELFLMKRGGEEIYVGPLGHNSFHLINYFEGIQGVSKIKDGHNPATWMLEVTTPAQESLLGINFSEVYKKSELCQRNKALIVENSRPSPGSQDLSFPTQYSQPFLTQCLACLWKQHLSYWRNTSYTVMRFVFTMMIAAMLGTIFWNLGGKKKKQQDLFNALGSMYSAVLFIGISYSNGVQPVVAIERTVFYRERAAGKYSAISLTPNLNIASIIVAAFYSIWNLFGGFVIPRPAMPVWWRWYYWACPVSWSLYGLLVSQYGDVNEMLEIDQTVEEFLRCYFGFKHDFLGVVAVMVVLFAAFFAFLFGFAIKVLNFQRR
ncbi:ABC transporter G family member 35-like isoform X2 [Phalaenopsis equestris]|uniref:ABC transporter G family member 35-like isoform X2 n=1 Tax=Phalaenopsis equestris TaxID=78828 RepID=UPI0009E4C23B|nr:ABC transporter G family member 35-like isoform X2 [Phalaenopsis equestris]